MAKVRREERRLIVELDPGEALHMMVRHPPKEISMRTVIIYGAWELIKLHTPKKVDGMQLDKSSVDFIDGVYQVVFYPKDLI